MFDFVFNGIDLVLLVLLLTSLAVFSGGFIVNKGTAKHLQLAFGFSSCVSVLLTAAYFQQMVYQHFAMLLDSPVIMFMNISHFIVLFLLLILYQFKLTGSVKLGVSHKLYLSFTVLTCLFFTYRLVTAEVNLCQISQHCVNNLEGQRCNTQTYCIVSILYGLANLAKGALLLLAAGLFYKMRSCWSDQSLWLRLSFYIFMFTCLWRFSTAFVISVGEIAVEDTTLASLLVDLSLLIFIFIWLVSDALKPLKGAYLERQFQVEKQVESQTQNLQLFEAYIQQHEPQFKKNLTLTRLAEAVGISRNELSALINQQFGKSFNEYINQLRVDRFNQQFLSNKNDVTISQLFEQVGFNSKSTFLNAYKKSTGMTPSDYKTYILGADSSDTPI